MKFLRFFSDPKYNMLGKPLPAKQAMPSWYRAAETHYYDDSNEKMPGLKTCMPFLDGLVSGYVITTPVDIEVSISNGKYVFTELENTPVGSFVGERSQKSGATMPRPQGYAEEHFIWKNVWSWKTPRGWSILVTHPLNSFDLPFMTLSAIMDSDEFVGAGNIPFYLRDGFTGIIKAGTPIAQLIPIKRASWNMIEQDKGLTDLAMTKMSMVRNPDNTTSYKKVMWHKKRYD